MHKDKRLINRIVGVTLLAALSLMLIGGTGVGTNNANAAAKLSNVKPTTAQAQKSLVLRVYFRSLAERDSLAAEFGAEEFVTTGGFLTLWVDAPIYEKLQARGLRVEVDQKLTNEVNSVRWGSNGNTFYGGYLTVEDMESFMDQMVTNYPTLVQKVDIGDSWCKSHAPCANPAPGFNGYDQWVLHITNRAISGPKPVFWYDTGIHSREIATTETAIRLIRWFLDGYNSNADAHWMVDYQDIWIMPMLNPDGHHIVEVGGGGNSPYYQRKNANNTNGCTTYPPSASVQYGTDLNRNFPFLWNCCGGSSSSACDQTYHGTSAGSDPEVQAVMAKIRTLIPDQRGPNNTDPAPITTTGVIQNMHSNASLNLYPWGWTGSASPNNNDLAQIGNHMSALNAGGNGYQACQPPNCLYGVDGDSFDWSYGELGVPSFTTEIGGGSFFPPYSQVDSIFNLNKGALIYEAKIARMPYLTAHGPDANLVATNPMTVTQGTPSDLTATINHNWTANRYNQNIAVAEYYIDTPPWAGGTAIAMTGNFNSNSVPVQASIATGSLAPGRHVIFVRGRGINDYEGYQSWGPISAAFLDVTPSGGFTPTPTYTNTPQPTNTPTPGACEMNFSDVQPSDYFYEAVHYLFCNGVISGYGDGTFRPYNNTKRGQLSKIVVLAEGWPIDTTGGPHFTDVLTSHVFYDYIETAYNHAIINGYQDGTFRPDNNVTRAQLSKIIVLAQGWPTDTTGGPHFTDVPEGSTFYDYIETAYNHGIITGYGDGTFRPDNNATRGQISVIVYRAVTNP